MFRLAWLALLCFASLARAETIVIAKEGATLEMASPDLAAGGKLRLAGQLTLRCRVAGVQASQAEAIPLRVDEKLWQLVADISAAEEGPVPSWERRIILEPMQPGSLALPAIGVRFRGGPGQDWKTVTWTESVEVIGPPVSEAGKIRGETPIEQLPDSPTSVSTCFWLLPVVLGAIVLLAGVAVWWLLRQLPAPPVLPPHQQALRALESLRNVPAPHALLSLVLRKYVETRFGLAATRRTTEEVVSAARGHQALGSELCGELEKVLRECDRVKFAGGAAPVAAAEELLALARGWIDRTAPAGSEEQVG